jgi:hypothetical protein
MSQIASPPNGIPVIGLAATAVDLLQFAYDIAGIEFPTAAAEGPKALARLASGTWLEPAIRGQAQVPYVGELVNAGRLQRYQSALQQVIGRWSPDLAAGGWLDGLRQLQRAMNSLWPDHQLTEVRQPLDRFLAAQGVSPLPRREPDISGRFDFQAPPNRRSGNQVIVFQRAAGRLGIPGKVRQHRSSSAQRTVSRGTGDDAGHLIGNQFGAPGDARNLTRQNLIMNEYGTWKDVELRWADDLKNGWGINVEVTDFIHQGDPRPYRRDVTWKALSPLGGIWVERNLGSQIGQVLYPNFSTPESRGERPR